MKHLLVQVLEILNSFRETDESDTGEKKVLPDNLEDAIILSFLWAEYFVKKCCALSTGLY